MTNQLHTTQLPKRARADSEILALEVEIERIEKKAKLKYVSRVWRKGAAAAHAKDLAESDVLIDKMFAIPAKTAAGRAAKVRVLTNYALGKEWRDALAMGDLPEVRTAAVLEDFGSYRTQAA